MTITQGPVINLLDRPKGLDTGAAVLDTKAGPRTVSYQTAKVLARGSQERPLGGELHPDLGVHAAANFNVRLAGTSLTGLFYNPSLYAEPPYANTEPPGAGEEFATRVASFKAWVNGNASYNSLVAFPDTRASLGLHNAAFTDALVKALRGDDPNLPVPLSPAEKAAFLDAVFAPMSVAGHGDNIRAIVKALAEKYPDEAEGMNLTLARLSANAMAAKTEASKTYGGWLAAAAFDATPKDDIKGALIDPLNPQEAALFAAALLSRPEELSRSAEGIANQILASIRPGAPTKGATEFAEAYIRYAPRAILERAGDLPYRALVSATRELHDTRDRATARRDAQALARVMGDPAMHELRGSPQAREIVLAAWKTDPATFPKSPAAAMAFLAPMLFRRDAEAWQGWQKAHLNPGQPFDGPVDKDYLVRALLSRRGAPLVSDRDVQPVIARIARDLGAGPEHPWEMRAVPAYVITSKGRIFNVPVIEATATRDGKTVAIDTKGSFANFAAWENSLGPLVTEDLTPPPGSAGVITIPKVGPGGQVSMEVRWLTRPISRTIRSGTYGL
jgi:hypothetical protein